MEDTTTIPMGDNREVTLWRGKYTLPLPAGASTHAQGIYEKAHTLATSALKRVEEVRADATRTDDWKAAEIRKAALPALQKLMRFRAEDVPAMTAQRGLAMRAVRPIDPLSSSDVAGAIRDWERRTRFRGLTPDERNDVIRTAIETDQPETLRALFYAEPWELGVSEEQHYAWREWAFRKRDPDGVRGLELEGQAIEAAGRIVEAAIELLRDETGLDPNEANLENLRADREAAEREEREGAAA